MGVAYRLLPLAPALTMAMLLTGCQGQADAPVGNARPATLRPTGYGAQFLGVGECSSFGTTSFTEVPCTSERAAAQVAARYDGTVTDGPLCPPTTDFVLHISEQRPQDDEDGDGAIPQGYACMRNLEPPHPGDPGAGGGPRTIPGDCVYDSGDGQVRETACDGSGRRKPQYRITEAVPDRSDCPASTVLYVQLSGQRPVGCARPV
ncbi:hypothetical protein [Streptomyces sp. Ag109_G2-15]|uniref:hypothetical protein n=1 Tax=Streptomyces sp. Ag109_G2-15 TaxID=1938850 RepID=UPI000BD8A5A8|nr:hypothetical protein [Streptomyces sp. Ag109_G2-15]SOD86421.1 hypothetical protein SAMN06272765_3879 [Streptomyces sp. Ag109_G2-15]